MRDTSFTVTENMPLAKDTHRMRLAGDTSQITRPGQFVNIKLEGYYLRRPIAVCAVDGDELTLIYKIAGHGTETMSGMGAGTRLRLLTGLGNGFNAASSGARPLLIGGGVGASALYMLAGELTAQGKETSVVLGFNEKAEAFYEEEFRALGCGVTVTTAAGDYGIRGFVTAALPREYSYFYACGPEAMLRAVYAAAKTEGQLSFERRMGCGFGACMGCSCRTIAGDKRICREGPVLEKGEILWES